jgi:gamma-glutamyltranspeptidase/glutathione hydrolase
MSSSIVPVPAAIGSEAMVATSNPLATHAAAGVLRGGGNAVDAAVAAAAVLAVAEPYASGLGGDCFALIAPAGEVGRTIAYNGSGRAPAAATCEWFADRGIASIDRCSPHAVTVPGAVEAWARLVADHGTLPLADVLAPAIALAQDGCPIHGSVAEAWRLGRALLSVDPATRRAFLPGGMAPVAGSHVRHPQLAATLRQVAEGGRAAFYEGRIAADLVTDLRARGGLHTLEDFATAYGEYVEPIGAEYRDGVEVITPPPNGQGVVALEMLRILSGFDLGAADPVGPRRLHLIAEAARLAFADRDAVLADPAHAPVPVQALLAEERIGRLRRAVRPDLFTPAATRPSIVPPHPDTTHVCVVDAEQTAVSLICSVFHPWGSGLTEPRTGVLLHSRGSGFVVDPAHPNAIGPGKRPMHTLIPSLGHIGAGVKFVLGVTGGHFQPTGQAYVLGNLVDHGHDALTAVQAPRAFPTGAEILVEPGIPAPTVTALQSLGHVVRAAPEPIGSAQLITIDDGSGTLSGAADPRRDGCVIGW